ncbi:MAG: NAD(P)/FAD-dependent oxidoreductase [Chthonomonadaceae bacterium]|nr:NAD(P)/FAD-dependent oxidoreductase [Chthonomonadaceae bacterium]
MTIRYDYVIIGGGPASVWAAATLRENDKMGSILLIGEESHPPYDRPPLSKKMLIDDAVTVDDPYTKFDNFYPDNNIELKKNTRVERINRPDKTLSLVGGESVGYGKLLIATGARPNPPEFAGGDLPGVYLLRHIEDSLAIRDALKANKRLLLVGSGYIGMEVAAAGIKRGLEVTIVDPAPHPWSKFASPKFGAFIRDYYEKQGVNFLLGESVDRIEESAEGGLTVTLKSGKTLQTDMVVAGVGAKLNTELAEGAGLPTDPKKGIRTNANLQTEDPSIFVAGDVALFEDTIMGQNWHLEHHLNAKWQGQAVGKNMAGANEPYAKVPYFFSDEFDLHIIIRGLGQGGEETQFVGDVDGAEFTELYYSKEGLLQMGISVSRSEETCDALANKLETLILEKFNVLTNSNQVEKVLSVEN